MVATPSVDALTWFRKPVEAADAGLLRELITTFAGDWGADGGRLHRDHASRPDAGGPSGVIEGVGCTPGRIRGLPGWPGRSASPSLAP
jgi:hypothetical protein